MTIRISSLSSVALLLAILAAAGGWTSARGQSNAPAPTRPGDKLAELFGDPVIVRGKGLEIKRSEFDTALINLKAAAAARGQMIPPDQMNRFERQVLDDLIGMRVILGLATEADRAKAKEQFATNFAKFKTDAKLSDAAFEEKLGPQLRAQGLTREQWEKERVDQLVIALTLDRELKIAISDPEARKYYDEYPARFEEPEMVRASHVLIGTRDPATNAELPEDKKQAKRKLADDVLKRARAGEDFAKLAAEYSDDPGSKDKGGEYTFPRGQMVPEFESTAFSLRTNQISDIVTTQFGYHIIKLSEKIPAHKVEFEKVVDKLKEGLKQQELQKQLPDYIAKLKKDAAVEIVDAKLKAIDPEAGGPIRTDKPDAKKK